MAFELLVKSSDRTIISLVDLDAEEVVMHSNQIILWSVFRGPEHPLKSFLVLKELDLSKLVLELACFSSFVALVWSEGQQEGARTGASRGKGCDLCRSMLSKTDKGTHEETND